MEKFTARTLSWWPATILLNFNSSDRHTCQSQIRLRVYPTGYLLYVILVIIPPGKNITQHTDHQLYGLYRMLLPTNSVAVMVVHKISIFARHLLILHAVQPRRDLV